MLGTGDFRSERADFGFERANFGLERADLGSGRADLEPERGLGGDRRTYGWTELWMDIWKFTPVSYRTSALWGRCPKSKW